MSAPAPPYKHDKGSCQNAKQNNLLRGHSVAFSQYIVNQNLFFLSNEFFMGVLPIEIIPLILGKKFRFFFKKLGIAEIKSNDFHEISFKMIWLGSFDIPEKFYVFRRNGALLNKSLKINNLFPNFLPKIRTG